MSALPESYTAYEWEKPLAPLTKAARPLAAPKAGEVVVKVLACGMCATDAGVHGGMLPNPWPRVPGHEIIGDVAALGAGVTEFAVGQRVGAGWQRGFCGACGHCKAGKPMGCDQLMAFSTGGMHDGGVAQYFTVPASGVCAVPADLDPAEAAPLMCAGVTCYKSLQYLNAPKGATVAVHGIGGLGHLGIQYAKAMGYRTVAISSGGAKRELALRLGADVYIDESTQSATDELAKLGGADVILSTAPSSAAVLAMLPGLAFEGRLLAVSLPADTAPFSPVSLNVKRQSIHGYLCGSAQDCAETIAFSREHNVKCIVETFPLDKAQEAYEHRTKAKFRAVVVP